MKTLILLITFFSTAILACAQGTTDLSTFNLVASVSTYGEYDNAGLATWNGQPLSPQNQPSAEQDQLSATWNFYVNPTANNQLFVSVGNVLDTDYGTIFGAPFIYVALTGFTFTLAPRGSANLANPTYSGAYALPGETLLGNPIGSFTPGTLTSTPGWNLNSTSPNQYSFAASDVGYAFTHFSSVTGTSRIFGGGVFDLTFDSSVDLLNDVEWTQLQAGASNGMGMYTEPGSLIYAAPEPSILELLAIGGVLLLLRIGRDDVGCSRP